MSSLGINEIRPRSMFLLNFLSSREPISGPHPGRVGLLATFHPTPRPAPLPMLSLPISPSLPPRLCPLFSFFSLIPSYPLSLSLFSSLHLTLLSPLTSICSPYSPPSFNPLSFLSRCFPSCLLSLLSHLSFSFTSPFIPSKSLSSPPPLFFLFIFFPLSPLSLTPVSLLLS